MPAPTPPRGSFDAAAAARGAHLFAGKATCARCHVEPITSEPGWNLHTAAEICIDGSRRSGPPMSVTGPPPERPLDAPERRFYHDGRFPTLLDVINHYNATTCLNLQLTDPEKLDLVQYLLSLPEEGRFK